VNSTGGEIIRLEILRSKFVEALRGRVTAVAEMLTEIQNSSVLLTELKTFSLLFVWMIQAEMQKLILELTLISFYATLKEANPTILADNFAVVKQFSLEKFALVIS